MSKELKALRKENAELLQKINDLGQDFETFKSRMVDGGVDTNGDEAERSLQFLSDEYDSFKGFSKAATDEMQKLSTSLGEIEKRAQAIEDSVDSLLHYSYQYNLKITGIPQTSKVESAIETSSLCLTLFHKIGATDVTLQDIDIAHRIPNRRHDRENWSTIICKFARRLPREVVLRNKRHAKSITIADLGFEGEFTNNKIFILEHLPPKMQDLFNRCKQFQRDHDFKFCWVKNLTIFLKRDEDSGPKRITKQLDLDDLGKS